MTIEIIKTDGSEPDIHSSKTVEINKTGGGPSGEAPAFSLSIVDEGVSVPLTDEIEKVTIT